MNEVKTNTFGEADYSREQLPDAGGSYAGYERAEAVVGAELGRAAASGAVPFGVDGLLTELPATLLPVRGDKNPPSPKPTTTSTEEIRVGDIVVIDDKNDD